MWTNVNCLSNLQGLAFRLLLFFWAPGYSTLRLIWKLSKSLYFPSSHYKINEYGLNFYIEIFKMNSQKGCSLTRFYLSPGKSHVLCHKFSSNCKNSILRAEKALQISLYISIKQLLLNLSCDFYEWNGCCCWLLLYRI